MIFHEQQLLDKELDPYRVLKKKVGLVPTMGALHEGHLALVKKSVAENEITVVSIFVNPTQFDNSKDLQKYPRTLDEDSKLLRSLNAKILIYAPQPDDLYGNKVVSKRYSFGGLEKQMEGKFRSGHFDGVGTVLNLLFRAIRPDQAYFGEKDFQQLQIVRKLVEIEKLPINIVGCPIYREPHGLAMSSRNKRLSQVEFDKAGFIFETLQWVRSNFSDKSIPELQKIVQQKFKENNYLELEYFEIANIKNLIPAKRKRKRNKYRAFIAAFAGEVRLIDNMALN